MIFKNIAEYEDTDSELAKFTISQMQCKIQELARLNIEKVDIILKAIEYIEKQTKELYKNCDIESFDFEELLEILKGKDNE